MARYSFIAAMPDEPGRLHKAAKVIKEHGGNINRISFDRKIDSSTVFFEVSASEDAYMRIKKGLEGLGYLQKLLKPAGYLKFDVYVPHRPGALFEFLGCTSRAKANIAFLDFDDRRGEGEKLTVAITLDDPSLAEGLLEELKTRYRIEILEYDSSGRRLDDTVFYVRFAGEIREIIGGGEEEFLMRLLSDVNHIVQELGRRGEDVRKAFESILLTGRTLKKTSVEGFYASVQRVELRDGITLFCFQPPCGGNVYALDSGCEKIVVDTGYGIYHRNISELIQRYLGSNIEEINSVFLTHADADHAGGAGFYACPVHASRETWAIIESANRAYGSSSQESVLEEVYTKLINLFSGFKPPEKVRFFAEKADAKMGDFQVRDSFTFAGKEFSVLESLGGHMHGQNFFVCEGLGLVFSGDAVLNFDSLTTERKEYNLHAKNLLTSVNVDSKKASEERKKLMKLAEGLGPETIICCGHGAASKIRDGRLEVSGSVERYDAPK